MPKGCHFQEILTGRYERMISKKKRAIKAANVLEGGGNLEEQRVSGQCLFFGDEVLSTFSRTIRFGRKRLT